MKASLLGSLFSEACVETQVPSKSFALAGQIGKKAAAIDKKLQIRDRIYICSSWVLERLTGDRTAQRPRQGRRTRKGRKKSYMTSKSTANTNIYDIQQASEFISPSQHAAFVPGDGQ
jgi:hypothetical protein